jgi:N-acetylmuramoyl-L-alanine amidase
MKNPILTRKLLPSHPVHISLFSIIAAITLHPQTSLAAPTATLNKWQLNPKSQQLEITLSATTTPEYFYLAEPPRLVVDLPNTQLGKVNTQKNYSGTIQKIRVSQFSPNITRIVIDLKPGTLVDINQVKLQSLPAKNPTRWVLRPVFSDNNTSALNQPSSSSSLTTLPPPVTNLPPNQQPFVIVPPLNSQNPSQLSNWMMMPPNFPNSTNNPNMITIPNSAANIPTSQNNLDQNFSVPIIEFGQPIPTIK